jgi:hypothetical protein
VLQPQATFPLYVVWGGHLQKECPEKGQYSIDTDMLQL